jgi:ribosomal protein L14E/L6E/L27E
LAAYTPPGLRIGQLVFSKAGRDRGRPFLVLKVTGDGFAYVVDGDLRRVARPKRKNVKHLQPTNRVDRELAARIESGKIPTDAEIRRALAALTGVPGGEEEGDGEKGGY